MDKETTERIKNCQKWASTNSEKALESLRKQDVNSAIFFNVLSIQNSLVALNLKLDEILKMKDGKEC